MDIIKKYSYSTIWEQEKQCWKAFCLEFPAAEGFSQDVYEALEQVYAQVEESVKWLMELKEELPLPLKDNQYSGTIELKVSSELHRTLVMEAAREGLSLNEYLLCRMALPQEDEEY